MRLFRGTMDMISRERRKRCIVLVLLFLMFIAFHVVKKPSFSHLYRLFVKSTSMSALATRLFLKHHNIVDSGRFICPKLSIGRLGNKLFITAALYSLAVKKNKTLVIAGPSGRMLYSQFSQNFDSNIEYVDIKHFCFLFKSYPLTNTKMNRLMHSDESIEGSVRIVAYLQSLKHFENNTMQIRNLFQFKSSTLNTVRQILRKCAKNAFKKISVEKITFIGVHIRRGDMLKSKFGYQIATEKFLKNAIYFHNVRYAYPVFVVRSDDRIWTKKLLLNPKGGFPIKHICIPDKELSTTDMAILSNCNHSIISTGTYSWWSGFLAGGTVVYFKNFSIPGSRYDKFLDKDNYKQNNWIGM